MKKLKLFSLPDGGIGNLLSNETEPYIFKRLGELDRDPLPKTQLNQLLALAHEAPLTDGFFCYYWLTCPELHPYDVTSIPDYDER